MEFYVCRHCGNVIAYAVSSGVKVQCCGEEMGLLKPNTSDGAAEKHVPVVEVKGTEVVVKVGETLHPMEKDHYIEWIALETKKGNQRHVLEPGALPVTEFAIVAGDEVVAAYAYCNKHGLWKKEK